MPKHSKNVPINRSNIKSQQEKKDKSTILPNSSMLDLPDETFCDIQFLNDEVDGCNPSDECKGNEIKNQNKSRPTAKKITNRYANIQDVEEKITANSSKITHSSVKGHKDCEDFISKKPCSHQKFLKHELNQLEKRENLESKEGQSRLEQSTVIQNDNTNSCVQKHEEIDGISTYKKIRHANNEAEKENFKNIKDKNDIKVTKYDSSFCIHLTQTIPPWLKKNDIYFSHSPAAVGLHHEIESFYKYISPTIPEERMRQDVVNRIERVIHGLWPLAKVETFGSFRTKLYLPTSDIDLVLFGDWGSGLPLRTLEKELLDQGIASDSSQIKVLDKALVPIIKLTDAASKVSVDICFNRRCGLLAADLIQGYMIRYPTLPKLVVVLKLYLQLRDLNEVFTGGISSYCVILLVISFLQTHLNPDARKKDANLGVLLMEFFELYGKHFNYSQTGICFSRGGGYFQKNNNSLKMIDKYSPSFLSVEDPIDPENDIGKGSYCAMAVKVAFDNAYKILSDALRQQPVTSIYNPWSILHRIVHIPLKHLEYRQWINKTYGAMMPTTPLTYASAVVSPSKYQSRNCHITSGKNSVDRNVAVAYQPECKPSGSSCKGLPTNANCVNDRQESKQSPSRESANTNFEVAKCSSKFASKKYHYRNCNAKAS